jgi:hypothetical protein
VQSGTHVQFGQVTCEILDARSLYPLLKAMRL